jgi:uncharacterized protein (DUF1330 family)
MNTNFKIALAVVTGTVLGAAAVQGLHAQAKLKAYAVAEIEVIDAAAQAAYTPQVVAALRAAGGLPINSAGGRIVAYVGEAPKRVAISEWDSVEQAQAFLNSPSWKNLAPQRDKAQKIVRGYIVENAN